MKGFSKNNALLAVATLLPLLIFFGQSPDYLITSTFFWVCLLTLPLSLGGKGKDRNTFFICAILIGIVTIFLPTTIGVYMIAFLILLMLLENGYGIANCSLIVHVFLISPLYTYFSSLISFPLRLHLSEIVTDILQAAGFEVFISGNLVSFEGTSFLIDEACAGLHMLGYGLLTGTLIIAHFHRKNPFSTLRTIGYYSILLLLIVIGNIVRITLLILFKIMPDFWFHEGLGILIYLFQIILPFYLLVQITLPKPGNEPKITYNPVFPKIRYSILLMLMLFGSYRNATKKAKPTDYKMLNIPNQTMLKDGTIKVIDSSRLLYIKPPVPGYRADHNPMVCWKGSGYNFKKIEVTKIGNLAINMAELVKGKEKLYTAWWYESTDCKTGNQWEWRKKALLNNTGFYLVNLTCATEDALLKNILQLLNKNHLFMAIQETCHKKPPITNQ